MNYFPVMLPREFTRNTLKKRLDLTDRNGKRGIKIRITLLAGNFKVQTRSIRTASSASHSLNRKTCGIFLEKPRPFRGFAES
jgi:hypothetical protein